MKALYTMLAAVGWGWCGVVGAFLLAAWLRRRGAEQRSFEVMERHDDKF